MKPATILVATALLPLSALSNSEIIEIPNSCIALYQESDAVPDTAQCEINAGTATVTLGTYRCTASPEWVGAYCNSFPEYDETPDDDNFTQYRVETAVETPLPDYDANQETVNTPANTGSVESPCEAVANSNHIPTVPQPLDAYVGMASLPYSALSTSIAMANFVESHEQFVQTNDSSEMFNSAYSLIWGLVLPVGNAIGMDDVFQSLSDHSDQILFGEQSCN